MVSHEKLMPLCSFYEKAFHPAARSLFSLLFGIRVTFVVGDSTQTLPSYSFISPCDLVSVDGGHSFEVARADVLNFYNHSSCGSLILMDDIFHKHADDWNVHHVDGAMMAWDSAISDGLIEQYGCYETFEEGPDFDFYAYRWDHTRRIPRSFCIGGFTHAGCNNARAKHRATKIINDIGLTPCSAGCCN